MDYSKRGFIKEVREEKNRVLAVFMNDNQPVDTHHNRYNKDWNELMAVIDKLQGDVKEPEELDELKDALWWNDIEVVFDYAFDAIYEMRENN